MAHGPTRLPYGVGLVKPGASSTQYTFVAGDTKPDVSYGTYFVTASSACTIVNFRGGERGKFIYVYCNTGGAVVIQNSAGGINIQNIVTTVSNNVLAYSATGGNATLLNKEVAHFIHNGTDWSYVGIRNALSTL